MMLLSIGLSVAFVIIVLLVVGLVLLGERVDWALDGVYEHMARTRGIVGDVDKSQHVLCRGFDGRLDALEASDRLNVVLLRDVEQDVSRVVTIARCATDGATTHAQCALCGKVGHVADMDVMSEAALIAMVGPVCCHFDAMIIGGPYYLHPECLAEAGCERAAAVAGGWRRKVVAE